VNVVTCDWDCNKGINNPNGVLNGVTRTTGDQKWSSDLEHCIILIIIINQLIMIIIINNNDNVQQVRNKCVNNCI
jgi:hypothetical protein